MPYRIVAFPRHDAPMRRRAAQLLVEEFRRDWPRAWPTFEAAAAEVTHALRPEKVSYAAVTLDGVLLGWIGAQPEYEGAVWELHPVVVDSASHGQGIGRALVRHVEDAVRERGALTLWVGTDDEANLTSLGGADLYPGVLDNLMRVVNLRRHPIGFYQRLGFEVAGVVPDANGFGKPDILMAKRVRGALSPKQ